MISFKTRDDMLSSVLILLAILVIVAIPLLNALYPVSDAATIKKDGAAERLNLYTEIIDEKKQAEDDRTAISAKLWKGDENSAGAAVMGVITSFSVRNLVKLTAFRPQRTIALGGVTELPYTVQLAGTFADIRHVMRDLDADDSKVVLRSLQVNSSEEASGTVTATLGVSAFIADDPDIAQAVAERSK